MTELTLSSAVVVSRREEHSSLVLFLSFEALAAVSADAIIAAISAIVQKRAFAEARRNQLSLYGADEALGWMRVDYHR